MSFELFHLARHGRTAGNEKNIYRGWSNKEFAQLDDSGKDDAREAGIFLKGLGLEFPLIIVDDLDRTKESAQIIADILGIKDIVSDKRMRPLDVGDFTGKSKEKYPLDEYLKDKSKKIPGGESVSTFDRRQSKVFDDILQTIIETGQPILVVGHGSNVSYLHNAVQKDKKVGYEGLVNPGGIVSFSKDAVTPIFKKRDGKEKKSEKSEKLVTIAGIHYPADHKVGVEVPEGGSACIKCEYVNGQKCKEKHFIKWNGGDEIPKPTDRYCCDFFEAK